MNLGNSKGEGCTCLSRHFFVAYFLRFFSPKHRPSNRCKRISNCSMYEVLLGGTSPQLQPSCCAQSEYLLEVKPFPSAGNEISVQRRSTSNPVLSTPGWPITRRRQKACCISHLGLIQGCAGYEAKRYIPLATGYIGYTGTRIYPRGNKKKLCDSLGASNVGNVGEQFAVCTRILYPVTTSVPGPLERPRRLGRSKRRCVGTLFVTGYNMRVHVYPHKGTFRTLSEHVGNNTVYPGTKSSNTCSHVPICCRHTMVLRFHPQPEPSRGGSNRGR